MLVGDGVELAPGGDVLRAVPLPGAAGVLEAASVGAHRVISGEGEGQQVVLALSPLVGAVDGLQRLGEGGELGAGQYSLRSLLNNTPAVAIPISQAPGANALELSDAVRATMKDLAKNFPQGIEYHIAMDTTAFTRASIETVVHTFFEALVLVVLVVFLFLQSLRATLIPIIAVPVSIIGTAVGMTALGFSINMLTLFGEARQRTEDEYRDLFRLHGLELVGVLPTESSFSLVEARSQ